MNKFPRDIEFITQCYDHLTKVLERQMEITAAMIDKSMIKGADIKFRRYGSLPLPDEQVDKNECGECIYYKNKLFWMRGISGLKRISYSYCPICGRSLV